MALQMTEEVIANRRDELIGLGMDAAEAPDPPEQFVESFRARGRGRAAPHEPRGRGRTAREHHDVPRRARLRADRPRLPHPRRRRRGRALPRRRHPLHVLPDVDRGRLRLARSHDASDQRDDAGRAARAPQLRRPDDVPHRHRQGVRRLRRPERLPARDREAARAQRRRRDVARRRRRRPRCTSVFDDEIAALDKELGA